MTSICFVCNLPIMSHQVGLVWQGGNGWDEMVREQVKICCLFCENWDDKFSAGTENTKQTHTHVQQHNMAIESKRNEAKRFTFSASGKLVSHQITWPWPSFDGVMFHFRSHHRPKLVDIQDSDNFCFVHFQLYIVVHCTHCAFVMCYVLRKCWKDLVDMT